MATKKKDGRGRPKVKHERKHQVSVRLNDKEIKMLERYLKKHKIGGISPFIRKVVMSKVMQLDLFEETPEKRPING